MSWVYLALAILTEVAGTSSMKFSEGFAKILPSVLIFVFYAVSFVFMTLALKKLDLSITYAVWSGLGTALIVVIGMIWFREPITVIKVVSIALILAGVVGLNLAGEPH